MFQKILFAISMLILLNACGPLQASPSPKATISLTSTNTSTPTSTLTPMPSSTPSPTPTMTPVGGGTGQLILSMARGNGYFKGYEVTFPDLRGKSNIFTSNLDGTNLISLTDSLPAYSQIESFSPDGKNILASAFEGLDIYGAGIRGKLYLLTNKDSKPTLITNSFFRNSDDPGALWLDNSRILYKDFRGGEFGIFVFDTNTKNLIRVSTSWSGKFSGMHNEIPERILYSDQSYVYWVSFNQGGVLPKQTGLWRSSLDGLQQEQLTIENFDETYWNRIFISPDGKWFIWDKPGPGGNDLTQSLYVAPVNGEQKSQLVGTLPNRYRFLFSPDGSKMVLLPFYGSLAENSYNRNLPIYQLSLETLSLQKLFVPKYAELTSLGQESLSPDGRSVIVNSFTVPKKHTEQNWKATIINLDTETYSEFDSEGMGRIFWIPAPHPTETPAPTATATPMPAATAEVIATQQYTDFLTLVQKEHDDKVLPSLDGQYRRLDDVVSFSAKNHYYKWTPLDFKADNFIVRADVVMETARHPTLDSGCGFVFRTTNDQNAFVFLKQDGTAIYGMNEETISKASYNRLSNPSNFQMTLVLYQKKLRLMIDDKQILALDSLDYVDGLQGGWSPAVLSGSTDHFGTRCSFSQMEFWQIGK